MLIVAAFFCLSSGLIAPELDSPVTYRTRAANAGRVVKELGNVAGVTLSASEEMSHEVLLIDVAKQPLKSVMSKIETVTSGKWLQEGASFRLVPDQVQRKDEERKEARQLAKELDRSIAAHSTYCRERLLKTQKELEATEKPVGETLELMRSMIGDREALDLTEVVTEIGSSRLATMKVGERLVFSDRPTPIQSRLSDGSIHAISDLIRTHNEGVQQMKSHLAVVRPQMPVGAAEEAEKSIPSTIPDAAKVVLAVERASFDPAYMYFVDAAVLDRNSVIDYHEHFGLRLDEASSKVHSKEAENEGVEVSHDAKGKEIDYSPYSRHLLILDKGTPQNGNQSSYPAQLIEKLIHPSTYDPLSFIQTDEVMAYADAIHRQVIADIPDNWTATAFMMGEGQKSTLEDVIGDIKQGNVLCEVPDPEIVVLKPSRPFVSRQIRGNRIALETLLTHIVDHLTPSLDELGEFVLAQNSVNLDPINGPYLRFFISDELSGLIGNEVGFAPLRLYAKLSSEQRRQLLDGKPLGFSGMTPVQLEEVARLVYAAGGPLIDSAKPPGPTTEPTELLSNGISGDGLLTAESTAEWIGCPLGAVETPYIGTYGIMSVDSLAEVRLARAANGGKEGGVYVTPIRRIQVGKRYSLRLKYRLTPSVTIEQTLYDNRFDRKPVIAPENNLPAEFEQAIASAAAKAKGGGGGTYFVKT